MGGKSDGLSKKEERGVSREKGRIFESLDLCRGRSAEYITLSKWIEEPPTVSTYLGRKRTFA
jgi:hypothetical protein